MHTYLTLIYFLHSDGQIRFGSDASTSDPLAVAGQGVGEGAVGAPTVTHVEDSTAAPGGAGEAAEDGDEAPMGGEAAADGDEQLVWAAQVVKEATAH